MGAKLSRAKAEYLWMLVPRLIDELVRQGKLTGDDVVSIMDGIGERCDGRGPELELMHELMEQRLEWHWKGGHVQTLGELIEENERVAARIRAVFGDDGA